MACNYQRPRPSLLRIDLAKIHVPVTHQQSFGVTLDAYALARQSFAHKPSVPLFGQHPLRIQWPYIAAHRIFPFLGMLYVTAPAWLVALHGSLHRQRFMGTPVVVAGTKLFQHRRPGSKFLRCSAMPDGLV